MESMTGYGTAEGRVGKGRLFVEVKSVNHRFCEINVKIPNRMGAIESHVRSLIVSRFTRGKIDVFFKEKEPLFGGVSISLDMELAREYQRMLKRLKRELGLKAEESFLQSVGLDRILRVQEREGLYERLWAQISRLVNGACRQAAAMRVKEGAHIAQDQRMRLKVLLKKIAQIRKLSDSALGNHLNRLRQKVTSSTRAAVDEQRLQEEVAYLGGRQDIAEELLRLESHAKQYLQMTGSREPVGRKLDFLLQEMHREINTIGSKAADAVISQKVVDCKSELERLREQIQNVQ